jgi:hypothetical protein
MVENFLQYSFKLFGHLSLFSRSPYSFAVTAVSSSTDIRTRMIGGPIGIWIKIHLNPKNN